MTKGTLLRVEAGNMKSFKRFCMSSYGRDRRCLKQAATGIEMSRAVQLGRPHNVLGSNGKGHGETWA